MHRLLSSALSVKESIKVNSQREGSVSVCTQWMGSASVSTQWMGSASVSTQWAQRMWAHTEWAQWVWAHSEWAQRVWAHSEWEWTQWACAHYEWMKKNFEEVKIGCFHVTCSHVLEGVNCYLREAVADPFFGADCILSNTGLCLHDRFIFAGCICVSMK